MADGGEQVGDVMVVETVVGVAAGATHGDEPELAQDAQLVGYGALLHPCGVRELFDAALAVEQRPQQTQAAGRAERAHRLGDLLGLL